MQRIAFGVDRYSRPKPWQRVISSPAITSVSLLAGQRVYRLRARVKLARNQRRRRWLIQPYLPLDEWPLPLAGFPIMIRGRSRFLSEELKRNRAALVSRNQFRQVANNLVGSVPMLRPAPSARHETIARMLLQLAACCNRLSRWNRG